MQQTMHSHREGDHNNELDNLSQTVTNEAIFDRLLGHCKIMHHLHFISMVLKIEVWTMCGCISCHIMPEAYLQKYTTQMNKFPNKTSDTQKLIGSP